MLNLNKCTKTKPKPKPLLIFKNCACVCVSLCTTIVHKTAQNSSDNFSSYPPITIAQMMSTGGEGEMIIKNTKITRKMSTFLVNMNAIARPSVVCRL